MTLDMERWGNCQSLYDILVLGLKSEDSRADYIVELYCLGVDESYMAEAANVGLAFGIDARQMAKVVWSVEEDYCYAVRRIEKFEDKQLVVHPDVRDRLIVGSFVKNRNISVELFDLVEEATRYLDR